MELKSLSASSIANYEGCPKRWEATYTGDRPAEMSGTAAALGSALHLTLENYVTAAILGDADPKNLDVMASLWENAYWHFFADAERYGEGVDILNNWWHRSRDDYWANRSVLSTETKKTFTLGTSAGVVPVTYICDRVDRLASGAIEVIDYKSYRVPLTPDEIRPRIQPRLYGVAMMMEHPDIQRVLVTYDLLRYGTASVWYTREELRGTYRYVVNLAERIIADNDPQETLNADCQYCIRKSDCAALRSHVGGGGVLGVTPRDAVDKLANVKFQLKGLKALETELNDLILDACQADDEQQIDTDAFTAAVTARRTRTIDPDTLAEIIGPHLYAKFGTVTMGNVDALLKSGGLNDSQMSRIKQAITKEWGKPSVKITSKKEATA